MAGLEKYNGGPLPGGIASEIHARGAASPASAWKVNKRPWIKLVSNSSAGMTIFNPTGTWTVGGMHETSGRIVPKPTCTGVEISSTGTTGAMRKGTIKYKVFSISQLKQARNAFMIPGMTAVCTWGWNIKSDGSGIIHFPGNLGKSMAAASNAILDWSSGNNYCTDGIFGLISDFEWSFNDSDGSFDCSVTMESAARAYASTDIHVASKQTCGCKNDEDTEKAEGVGGWVKQALKNIAEQEIEKGEAWSPDGFCGTAIALDEDAKEDAGFFSALTGFFGAAKENFYVTWDWWESYCITSGLAPQGANFTPNAAAAKGSIKNQGKFGKHVWWLDSSDVYVQKRDKPWFSADPWICMIPGHYHWDSENAKGGGSSGNFGILSTGGLPTSWTVGPEGGGALREILLNTYYLWNTYLNSDTVDQYVMAVAKGVSDACGGMWNFELITDPRAPEIMKVIDTNKMAKASGTSLKVWGNDTAVRSWGMSTNIPQALKHSIMMGSGYKGGKVNDGKYPVKTWNMYGSDVTDNLYGTLSLEDQCKAAEFCVKGEQKSSAAGNAHEALLLAAAELADNRDDEAVDEAKGALKAYWQVEDNPADTVGEVTIPVGFDCTFEGIGGFQWGHMLSPDRVMGLVPNAKAFQVTEVKQSVSITDWTTTIATALRM